MNVYITDIQFNIDNHKYRNIKKAGVDNIQILLIENVNANCLDELKTHYINFILENNKKYFTNDIVIAKRISDDKIIVIIPYGDTEIQINKYLNIAKTELQRFQGSINYNYVIGTSKKKDSSINAYKSVCNKIYWLGTEKSKDIINLEEQQFIFDCMALAINNLLGKI